jgi:PAS domain S-box-containing protein
VIPPPSAHPDEVFHRVFDAYPDAVLVVDADGFIVLANTVATALFGYPIEALVGMPVDALVPDAARAGHAAHRAGYAAAPKPRPMGTDLSLRARRADGSEVMVEISLSPLGEDAAGRVVAAVRGIEAYPRVQRALQRARYSDFVVEVGRIAVDARDPAVVLQRMPALAIEALGVDAVAVFLLDGDRPVFRVAACAGAGCEGAESLRIGADAATPVGRVAASGAPLLIGDAAAETRFAIDASVLAQGMASGVAVPLSDRGRTIGVLCAWSRRPHRFGDEEASFLQTLANLLASSQQRAQSEAQLSHAQRLESVGQLTGGIAHDFNNLLTVIQGNLQMLAELPAVAADPLASQMAAAAARAGQRGADLTGKLLAFSRRQALAPVAVDPGALLQSLADMLRRTLGAQIRVEVRPGADCPRCIADPVQLESALLNVAINARDAMPGGGTLTLRCGRDPGAPDRVRIAVQDTGHGMSDEVRARAFEPFYTTKEAGRGTGLGLSTVYGFVTQSRGSIELESRIGAGTTVTLRLPAAEGASAPALRDTEPAALPPGLSVLLVEDDPGVAGIARAVLATLGCTVTACTTAAEAMAQLDGAAAFDLLFSDIALGPGPDGVDVARHARLRRPRLPVLLSSGDPRPQAADGDGRASPWPLLHKPYARGELAAAIDAALQRGR